MKNGSVRTTMKNLDKIRANVSKDTFIKVGVMGDHASRHTDTTINNPEIGVVQELGSVTLGIPARSFLRMPLEQHVGDIAMFMGQPKILAMVLTGNINKAFKLVGIYAETWVQRAFETRGFGQWEKNSDYTIAQKGSASPLIDTGQLRRAVSSEVVNGR